MIGFVCTYIIVLSIWSKTLVENFIVVISASEYIIYE